MINKIQVPCLITTTAKRCKRKNEKTWVVATLSQIDRFYLFAEQSFPDIDEQKAVLTRTL